MSLDPGFPIAEIQEVSLELPRNAPADALPRIREALTTAGLPQMAFSSLRPITGARMEIGVRHPNQRSEQNRRLRAATGLRQLFRGPRHSLPDRPAV